MAAKPWSVAFWLLAWQGGSMALAAAVPNGGLLLASPLESAARLLELLPSAAFWRAVLFSSARILGGFFLGCTLAVPLAAAKPLLCCWSVCGTLTTSISRRSSSGSLGLRY